MKAISMNADPALPCADPVTIARQFGWTNVEIIDGDLSCSGGIADPLTSPIYAGAYAFGRKRIRRGMHRPMVERDKPYVSGEAFQVAATLIWRRRHVDACPCRKLKLESIDGVARPRSATSARALFGRHHAEPPPPDSQGEALRGPSRPRWVCSGQRPKRATSTTAALPFGADLPPQT
jgi:hypothetical protein